MIKVSDEQAQAIEMFNNKLKAIESEIKQRGLEENQRVIKKMLTKENGITDYELNVEICMYREDDEEEVATWTESLKRLYLLDDGKNCYCNIDDNENHNVTTAIYDNKTLHKQKHCWLLHSLYDDIGLSFENILNIDCIWFDINVKYQYARNVKMESIC